VAAHVPRTDLQNKYRLNIRLSCRLRHRFACLAICRLSAGWATWIVAAALEKLPASTSRNIGRCKVVFPCLNRTSNTLDIQ
jgi:hypothetical protein